MTYIKFKLQCFCSVMTTVFFLLLVGSIASCSLPNYIFKNELQRSGVDFSSGKWLINYIDAPSDVKQQLSDFATEDFKQILNGRASFAADESGLLLPKNIQVNPARAVLSQIKTGTNFDFLIHIKARNTRSDLNPIEFSNDQINANTANINEVTLEIYDLNRLETIYSQTVVGSVTRGDDNEDVHFAKSSQGLIIGAYKKLIKDLKQKSPVLR